MIVSIGKCVERAEMDGEAVANRIHSETEG